MNKYDKTAWAVNSGPGCLICAVCKRLFQVQEKGDGMKGIALLFRIPDPPAFDPYPAFLDLFDHAFDINEGVPGKYVGESIGQAADQAFARPFDQVEGQYDSFRVGGNEFQPDVIGPVFCIPV